MATWEAPERIGSVTVDRLEPLARLAALLNRHADAGEMLDAALPVVCELLDAGSAWVFLLGDGDAWIPAATYRLPPLLAADGAAELRWSPCRCQRDLTGAPRGTPVNVSRCERLERLPLSLGRAVYHGSVVLRVGEELVGVLNIAYDDQRPLTPEELHLLDLIGESVSLAVHRCSLVARERSEQESWFRALALNASDLVIVCDRRGRLRYASPSVERTLGRDADLAPGRPARQWVHPDDLATLDEAWTRAIQQPAETLPATWRIRDATGAWRYVEVLLTNLLDDPAVGGVVLNGRDVTERHEAERALASSERRFRTLVQDSNELVVVFDPASEVTYVSPGCRSVLGRPPEELYGARTDLVHPDDRSRLATVLEHLDEGAGRSGVAELRVRHADGEWRHLEALFTDLRSDPDVGGVVMNARDVTDRVRFVQELARRTFYDRLTGLPNRALLLDRLKVALDRSHREPAMVAVILADLDRFSLINDSLGHDAGDAVLLEVARRIRATVPEDHTVAAVGGDEFGVLYECRNECDAAALAKALHEALREPVELADREVFVTASVGLAESLGGDATPESLLRDADTALSRAKRAGRNRVERFDASLRAHTVARMEIEHGLRLALARDELRVLYQPEVSLADGEVVGLEALVAWEHPERGLVAAAEFIDVAEDSGLVIPISLFVLREACVQVRRWASSTGRPPIPVSVNLSARHLDHPSVVDDVARAISDSGIDPGLVWLEITESALMEDAGGALGTLKALHALGSRIVVDDFGTGYSSLLYLRRFPVSVLKIDRSFVAGLGADAEDTAIVRAVIDLAHSLGLSVVAEGVENPTQMGRLLAFGCEAAQGYYWCPPVAADDLERWLDWHEPAVPRGALAVLADAGSDPDADAGASQPVDPDGLRLIQLDPDRRGDADAGGAHAAGAEAGGGVLRALQEASRALRRVSGTEEAVGVVITLVRTLGGWTAPARVGDPRALPLDLSLGEGEALAPVAEPGSPARVHLEAVLPGFLDDARRALETASSGEHLGRLAHLEEHGETDGLTGLLTRRALERILSRAKPGTAVVVVDLDGLGRVNDENGYQAGDLVLRSFSRLLRDHARAADRAARPGGDDFVLVLADTDAAGALAFVERLRAAWARARPYRVGMSVGVAEVRDDGADGVLGRACAALTPDPG